MNDPQWRVNPELVLPSPTSVMMLFEQDYLDYYAFDNSISLAQATIAPSDDSLGAYHMVSGTFMFGTIPKRMGTGNLVYFDGHVGSMTSEEFIIQRSYTQGTLKLIGGYMGFTWPGF
jgi:prepilin-type processing-associated H-X9-DG protein